ncbi:capsular polysaccharide transport system permease protein [Paracoccus isoporae]|uniref:Capsular polysaccharide transport system permease protein n=1 Tax=Paracoccus isoporae TaxID=591205 RepID=A0A1G7AJJ4_9RHOB|nr:capsule biosynthesis protein [Paracoccus isoporae]SDE15104.1 capsular polysaccharide transport system permease protein [Paracoccus isoporae]
MTTRPKVRIYRSKRAGAALHEQDGAGRRAAEEMANAERAANEAEARREKAGQDSQMAERIAAVKAEELTGRQLRLARRIATMHGMDVESDEEAVIALRERGVDPFHRSSLSKVMASAGTASSRAAGGAQNRAAGPATGSEIALRRDPQLPGSPQPLGQITPVKVPAGKDGLPSREQLTEEKRAAEIIRIQRDIARRRRRKQFWLAVRLLLLVGIPTLIAGWYYFRIATPLYETKSQFLIQQADSAITASGNSILSGIQLNPDFVAVQSYLTSKNAMLRLDEEIGFKSAFQDPSLDPLLRLPEDVNDDTAFKTFKDMVKVKYDPTEGVLNMDVVAPDPELSEQYSRALIRYAEGMVDDMTSRVREDQMAGAQQNYLNAEQRVLQAQDAVQELQQQMGVFDAESESSLVMNRITQLEGQLTTKRLELAQLESNLSPNASRVQGVRGDIERIQQMIDDSRSELTQGSDTRESIAEIGGRLQMAQADLAIRQELMANSAELLEVARVEANKQVRYLSLSVAPIVPEAAAYPKAVSNTIVAFLIFLGIYLLMSLTASILREQVST